MNGDNKAVLILPVDRLRVQVYDDRQHMGSAAAKAVSERIWDVLSKKEQVNMVFAAAPSQNEFLEELVSIKGIDWSRVVAFHLDEYLGLKPNSPKSFRSYLRHHIFEKVPKTQVHFLNGYCSEPDRECTRYWDLLREHPLDIACVGVGENGHIAFNDPHVADFEDPKWVKVVELDHKCRMQQVHDGCFESLDVVPTQALTLTIPAIMSARHIYCMVPGASKAEAVKAMLRDEISTDCPASILRTHGDALLFLDMEAAAIAFPDLEQRE